MAVHSPPSPIDLHRSSLVPSMITSQLNHTPTPTLASRQPDPPPARSLPTLLDKLLEHAADKPNRRGSQNPLAIVDSTSGVSKTYQDLLEDIRTLSASLDTCAPHSRFERQPILNLLPPGYRWLVTQLTLWKLDAINVPQAINQAHRELSHVIQTASIEIAICDSEGYNKLSKDSLGLGLVLVLSPDGFQILHNDTDFLIIEPPSRVAADEPNSGEGALMLFTSGTTGKPKGVLSTHTAIAQQCLSMGSAWEWDSNDRILHCLPLTHIHGIINALVVPLWYGATIEFLGTPFSPSNVWDRLLDEGKAPITILMAVPTIYNRLANHIESVPDCDRLYIANGKLRQACERLRLMISGSAPLSSAIKDRWASLTGHVLLERYGMTETGMILSCPLRPIKERLDGHVGFPLPGVHVRLRDSGRIIGDEKRDVAGEIEVSGISVFSGYYGDKRYSSDCFTTDRYFRTGDIAVRTGKEGNYRLLGRSSTDIIKSGGEKISALELERVISNLESVIDVSVIGLPDEDWGQVVGCVLVLDQKIPEKGLGQIENLRDALRSDLSAYKLPKKVRIYDHEIPRNAMGKVQKVQLAKVAFPECFDQSS